MIQINQNQRIKFLIQVVFVKKTNYDAKITEIEGKTPDVSGLATKAALNTVENKISNISRSAAKVELNAIDGNIPNITGRISKSDHDKDVNEIKNNYVTNSVLTSRLGNYVPYTDYDGEIELEIELERYSPLNPYFLGKSYFEYDGNQNYLIF